MLVRRPGGFARWGGWRCCRGLSQRVQWLQNAICIAAPPVAAVGARIARPRRVSGLSWGVWWFDMAVCTAAPRPPCVKGAVSRQADWGIDSVVYRYRATTPPSGLRPATSPYTGEALVGALAAGAADKLASGRAAASRGGTVAAEGRLHRRTPRPPCVKGAGSRSETGGLSAPTAPWRHLFTFPDPSVRPAACQGPLQKQKIPNCKKTDWVAPKGLPSLPFCVKVNV